MERKDSTIINDLSDSDDSSVDSKSCSVNARVKRKYESSLSDVDDYNETGSVRPRSAFFLSKDRHHAQLQSLRSLKENNQKMIHFKDKFLTFFNGIMKWPVEEDERLDLKECFFSFHFTTSRLHAQSFEEVTQKMLLMGCFFEKQNSGSSRSLGTFRVKLSLPLCDLARHQEKLKRLFITEFDRHQFNFLNDRARQFSVELVKYLNQKELCKISLAFTCINEKMLFKFTLIKSTFDFQNDMSKLGCQQGWVCEKEKTNIGSITIISFDTLFLNKCVEEHLNNLKTYFEKTYLSQDTSENHESHNVCSL